MLVFPVDVSMEMLPMASRCFDQPIINMLWNFLITIGFAILK